MALAATGIPPIGAFGRATAGIGSDPAIAAAPTPQQSAAQSAGPRPSPLLNADAPDIVGSDVYPPLHLSMPPPEKGVPTSVEEARMLSRGDADGYWRSRQRHGDPFAPWGVAFQNPAARMDTNFSYNRMLYALLQRDNQKPEPRQTANARREIGQIRLELARTYAQMIDRTPNHILSSGQVYDAHKIVWDRHRIPMTTFGGSALTGSRGEAVAGGSLLWYTGH